MKQTSIDWVLQYLNNVKPNEFCSIEKIKELLEQAKEMHKQEIIDAYFEGAYGGDNISGEKYYQETFVSKGSDETKEESLVEKMIPHQLKYNLDVMEKLASTLPQQEISDDQAIKLLQDMNKQPMRFHCVPKEISDEEIEKAAAHHEPMVTRRAWVSACKWYREQLKNK
jgi:hypothetical protein